MFGFVVRYYRLRGSVAILLLCALEVFRVACYWMAGC